MAINWSIEVIDGLIVGILIMGLCIYFYLKLKHFKFKSLFFFGLTLFLMSFYWIIEAMGDLFENIILAQISYILIAPWIITFILFINLSKKESVYSLSLIFTCLYIPVYITTIFLPDSVKWIPVSIGPGVVYWKFASGDILTLSSTVLLIIFGILIVYWGFLIWNNTPFLYKKEALQILISTVIIAPIALILSFLVVVNQTFVVLSDIVNSITIFLLVNVLSREPKLFYILPFIVHRIVVKDHEGFPLFDHDWSESEISENIFAGFINAVQIMSEKVMHVGRLLDINLQEGILIVYDSKFITVGLATSKSSILLRDCVKNFAIDFEEQFEYQLKTYCKDKKLYEPAYLLIDKYFSNFPYRIIPTERHPLLVSKEYAKIPLQLDDQYNQIFQNEEDLEKIKAELLRSPTSSHDDFLELYKELKDEKEINFDEEAKEQTLE